MPENITLSVSGPAMRDLRTLCGQLGRGRSGVIRCALADLYRSAMGKESEALTEPLAFVTIDLERETGLTTACWFLERKTVNHGRWLSGFSYDNPLWTDDPYAAIRFSREEDAAALCKPLGLFVGIGEGCHTLIATEHIFVSSPAPSQGGRETRERGSE